MTTQTVQEKRLCEQAEKIHIDESGYYEYTKLPTPKKNSNKKGGETK